MAKVGKPLGERDKQGWRIPRAGTVSRQIYDLLKAGCSLDYIREKTGKPSNYVNSIVFGIRHPDDMNTMKLGYYHKKGTENGGNRKRKHAQDKRQHKRNRKGS